MVSLDKVEPSRSPSRTVSLDKVERKSSNDLSQQLSRKSSLDKVERNGSLSPRASWISHESAEKTGASSPSASRKSSVERSGSLSPGGSRRASRELAIAAWEADQASGANERKGSLEKLERKVSLDLALTTVHEMPMERQNSRDSEQTLALHELPPNLPELPALMPAEPATDQVQVWKENGRMVTIISHPRSSGYSGYSENVSEIWLDQEEEEEEVWREPPPPGKVDVNRSGIIPGLGFTGLWIGAASALLLAMIWVYAFEEVKKQEDMATEVAMAYTRVHAAEVLTPAMAATQAVDSAFRGGAVTGLSDYAALVRLLEPHLRAVPALREAEIAPAPTTPPEGSVRFMAKSPPANSVLLVEPNDGNVLEEDWPGLDLRTDRLDCANITSGRGCALEPLEVHRKYWYMYGFDLLTDWWDRAPSTFWDGPFFGRTSPHEAICSELCWQPGFAYVAKIAGGVDPPDPMQAEDEVVEDTSTSNATSTTTTTTPDPPVPQLLMRVAMDTSALRAVIVAAEKISKGEVIICDSDGRVLVAADMFDTLMVNAATGSLSSPKVWELDRPWTSAVTPDMVEKPPSAEIGINSTVAGGSSVTVQRLAGQTNATLILGEYLRVVIAVPNDAFIDKVLGPLVWLGMVTSFTPVSTVAVATAVAVYLKLCPRRRFKR